MIRLITTMLAVTISILLTNDVKAQKDTTVAITMEQLKLLQTIEMVHKSYKDTLGENFLIEKSISILMEHLDPHSEYQTKQEVDENKRKQQPNRIGLGITCRIYNDTVIVATLLQNGPAYKAGMRPGYQIYSIGNIVVTNRGKQQEELDQILNNVAGDSIDIAVIRNYKKKIYQSSIDTNIYGGINAYYAPNDSSLYIKISSFNTNTEPQFKEIINKHSKKNRRNIILDLRDNPGGVLAASIKICDKFIDENNRITRKESENSVDIPMFASNNTPLSKSRVYILINENTASASEVVASCIQDYDKGLIIGRRSYGKGIAQTIFNLNDGSQIKLTTANLISPSGRCIQKNYRNLKKQEYNNDLSQRRQNNENIDGSRIPLNGAKYFTTIRKKRQVPGGIGVVPDVFVPEDTVSLPEFWNKWLNNNLIDDFIFYYSNTYRETIKSEYPTFKTFKSKFKISQFLITNLIKYCNNRCYECGIGIEKALEIISNSPAQYKIYNYITSQMALANFGANEKQEMRNLIDNDFQKALYYINHYDEYQKAF